MTPERIAALRAKNADRPPCEWPDRYLVDELLDALETQQSDIARLRDTMRTIVGMAGGPALADPWPWLELIEADAERALREAGSPDA